MVKRAKISEFCKTGSGGTPSRSQVDRYYQGGTIPWVKSGELRENIIVDTEEHVTEIALNETSIKLVPKGAILIAMYGATVGRLGILDTEATTNQAICHIVPDESVADTRYLYHALASQVPQIIAKAVGGAQPNITQEIVKNIQIELPSFEKQRRIATILDKADLLRAKQKEGLQLIDCMAQSIFVDMFGDPVRGNGRNPVQLLETLAAPERYSIVDGPFGSSIKPDDYVESGVPVVRITNITKRGEFSEKNLLYIKKHLFDALRRSSIRSGDVLVSRVGTIGNTCIFPDGLGNALLSTTGVCKITPNKKLILPEYLHCAIRMPSFQRQIHASASTSVQKYFNLSALKSWKLVVPSLVEQNQFVEKLKKLSALRKRIEDSVGHCDALSASVQYRAFRGEL